MTAEVHGTGKLDLDPIAFDLHDCLEDAMKTLAVRASQKRLELTCDLRAATPEALVGDPGRPMHLSKRVEWFLRHASS